MGAITTCGCLRSDSDLNDFWSKLQLRKIKASDLKDIIRHKQDKSNENKNISEANWKTVINLNLANPERKEISEKIFANAMNKSESKGSQAYLILSLLLLTEVDLPDYKNVKQSFIDLAGDHGFRHHMKVDEKGVYHVTKGRLTEVVQFYVDLVTLFAVDIIYADKKDITESLQKIFHEDIQKKYIDETILKEFKEDWINLDTFFISKYVILNKDEAVRESLWSIHDKIEMEKKAAELKAEAEKKSAELKAEAEKKAAEVKTGAEKKVEEAKVDAGKKVDEDKVEAEKKIEEAKNSAKSAAEKKGTEIKGDAEKKVNQLKTDVEQKLSPVLDKK